MQDLGFGHFTILLVVSLHDNERLHSYNFQKSCWNYSVSHFDSYCPSAEECSFLSCADALFTSLALNATKLFISFGRVKRQLQTWWSPEVEEAVSERRNAFAAVRRRSLGLQFHVSTCLVYHRQSQE